MKTSPKLLLAKVTPMLANLPSLFDLESVHEAFPVDYKESLNTVLRLEVGAFNSLLKTIKSSLGLVEQVRHHCSSQ